MQWWGLVELSGGGMKCDFFSYRWEKTGEHMMVLIVQVEKSGVHCRTCLSLRWQSNVNGWFVVFVRYSRLQCRKNGQHYIDEVEQVDMMHTGVDNTR